jgi:hypothetical protein
LPVDWVEAGPGCPPNQNLGDAATNGPIFEPDDEREKHGAKDSPECRVFFQVGAQEVRDIHRYLEEDDCPKEAESQREEAENQRAEVVGELHRVFFRSGFLRIEQPARFSRLTAWASL